MYKPRHIIGKTYDLTKENMNKLIKELEEAQQCIKEIKIKHNV